MIIDSNFEAELWQTAGRLRDIIAPADYKLFTFLHARQMKQTEASYAHWSLAA